MEAKLLFWVFIMSLKGDIRKGRKHEKKLIAYLIAGHKSCPISLLSVLLFVNHKLITSGLFVQTIEDLVENVKTSLVWCLSHST